jgi:uncharacterized caspase-like protein
VRVLSALTCCLLLMCSVGAGHAEKRVALVIGNSAYQNAPTLMNPKNDAEDIGKSLRDLGFSTIVATDLDRAGMNDVLDRFSRTVGDAEIALVYYAGHGMQFVGKNFLLPVEARLENTDDVNRFRLMPLDDVVDVLQGAPGARVIILDACRNNPVEDNLKRRLASMPAANRDAFLTRGLSRVVANGLIVAYATQANDVAADGTGRNSPFAAALLHHISTPDVDLRQMLFNVQDEVDQLTAGRQRPELSISLVGQYKLKPTTGAPANQEAAPVDAAAQVWAVSRDTTSQAVLEEFIRQFGNTAYGSMARARLEELKKTQVAAVAPAANADPPPSGATTQSAAGTVPALGGEAQRFDGLWITEVVCEKKGDAEAWSRDLIGRVKDAVFHGEGGVQGQPGWLSLDGTIELDGSVEILWKGFTGRNTRTTVGHVPPGRPYTYRAKGTFEGSRGSAIRVEGRTCHLEFTKQDQPRVSTNPARVPSGTNVPSGTKKCFSFQGREFCE